MPLHIKVSTRFVTPIRLLAYAVVGVIGGMAALGKIPKDQVAYYTHAVVGLVAMFGISFVAPDDNPTNTVDLRTPNERSRS